MAVREDVRAAARDLLDAVRDIPAWIGAPAADVREWWHRRRESGACDVPTCHRDPCWCYPAEEQAIEWRFREVQPAHDRAWRIYSRFRIEFDEVEPEVGELLGDRWVPERDELVRLLVDLVRGVQVGVDHKARAILAALAHPAESLAEVAERTRSPVVSLSTVKKLSAVLQEQGLVRREPDGTWIRTDEGGRVLGT
jgi:hypothetical protein